MENGHILNAIHAAKDASVQAMWEAQKETAKDIKEEGKRLKQELIDMKKALTKKNEALDGINNLWRNRKLLALCVAIGAIMSIVGPSGMVYTSMSHEKELADAIKQVDDAKKAYYHRRLKE